MTSEKFEFLVSGELLFDFRARFCPFLLVALCQWWAEKCSLRERKAPDLSLFPSEDLPAMPSKGFQPCISLHKGMAIQNHEPELFIGFLVP